MIQHAAVCQNHSSSNFLLLAIFTSPSILKHWQILILTIAVIVKFSIFRHWQVSDCCTETCEWDWDSEETRTNPGISQPHFVPVFNWLSDWLVPGDESNNILLLLGIEWEDKNNNSNGPHVIKQKVSPLLYFIFNSNHHWVLIFGSDLVFIFELTAGFQFEKTDRLMSSKCFNWKL